MSREAGLAQSALRHDVRLRLLQAGTVPAAYSGFLCETPSRCATLRIMPEPSLQIAYAPNSICFGCGPANPEGLRIQSYVQGDEVIADWAPEPHHHAFPGVLCGGIIGTLLDCHSNWAAAWELMRRAGAEAPSCTVTAEYAVKLLRPTPIDRAVRLVAKMVEASADRARIKAQLFSGEKPCATCEGTFVAVKPGHPAYHQWG